MESQTYKLIAEMYELLIKNDGRSLTSTEQARITATLRSLLVIYGEETPEPSQQPVKVVDSVAEARRPPRAYSRQHWWQKLGL